MMAGGPAVLVMAKAPRAGHVKTRLEPLLGGTSCAELQWVLLRRAVELAWRVAPASTFVAFDPPDLREGVAEIVGRKIVCFPQVGAHLGERLTSATEAVLARGHRPLIAIGTDVPLLGEAQLLRSLELLGSCCDVVFGPACDGGYYLVGLARPLPVVFGILPELWGGPLVLEASLECARCAGLPIGLLEPLRDLDTPEDAVALLAEPDLPADVRAVLEDAARGKAGGGRP